VDHCLAEEGWRQMWQATGLDPGVPAAVSNKPTEKALQLKRINSTESPRWDEIVTSPLQRCRRFAEQLAASFDLPLTVDPAWQEIDYGVWDGMPLTEWRKAAMPQFEAFRHDIAALHPPGGEAFIRFRDRILGAWQQILQRPDGARVLLITHGGVMRVVLPTVLGMPLNHTGVLEIPFACLSRVAVHGPADDRKSRLVGHNIAVTSD
jgi:broad specificity phosphatase PhoE